MLYKLIVFIFIVMNMIPIFDFVYTNLILGLVLLICSFKFKNVNVIYRSYNLWMITFMIFIAVSSLWSINPNFSLYTLVINVFPIFCLTHFLSKYIDSLEKLKVIVGIFYISSVIMMLYLYFYVDFDMIEGQRIGNAIVNEELADRWNANSIGVNLSLSIFGGYFLLMNSGNKFLKLLWIVLSIVMLIVIFITGSRKAVFIIIIPILVISMCNLKNNLLLSISLFVLGIIVFYVIMEVPFFYDIMGNRIDDLINIIADNTDGTEDVSRLVLIRFGLDWFFDNPILGYGMNCFRVLSNQTFIFSGRNFYAHNNYIEILVGGGIIGFLFYYSFVFFFLRKLRYSEGVFYKTQLSILSILLFVDLVLVSYYDVIIQILLFFSYALFYLEKKYNKYSMPI